MALLISASVLLGQTPAEQSEPSGGDFWPTDRMLRGVISRIADEKSLEWGLCEQQASQVREQFLERWTRFADTRRSAIQPLLTEYVESQFAMQAPDPEAVAEWSERASPVVDALESELTEMFADLREIVPADRHDELVKDALKTTAALEAVRAKLRLWREGDFNEREWWDLPPYERRKRKDARQAAPPAPDPDNPNDAEDSANAESDISPTVREEMDRWAQYVADFIRRYALNTAQTESANSILRECRSRALAHEERNRQRIVDLEKRIAEGKTADDAEKTKLKEELRALYGPIDAIFAEMQTRLEKLLTSAQSASAQEQQDSP